MFSIQGIFLTDLIYHNIAFASVHAPANDDPSFAVKAVDAINRSRAGCDWVLMGDYNTDPLSIVPTGTHPDAINKVYLQGTASRPQLPCLLIYPYSATQGPGGKRERRLDYAFLSDSLSRYRIWGVDNSKIYQSPNPNPAKIMSDHNMVAMHLGI